MMGAGGSEVADEPRRLPVPRRAWRALLIGSLGFSLMSFNTTATNLAFGDISDEFTGTSSATMSWVASIFFIGLASLLPLSGRLADRMGRRRIFRAGLLTFAAGSVLSAAAPNVYILIAARLVTAAGGALILPSSLAVVLPEFPKDRHFSAVAFWSATGPVASALAPGLSALLLAVADWRVLFLVSAPIALIAFVATFGSLRESRAEQQSGSLDLVGAVLGTTVVAAIVFGASFGSERGWTSAAIVGAFFAAAVLLPVFVHRCRVHTAPLLNLDVFTVRPVAVANVANFFLNFTSLANWLVWPLFFTRVWGFSKLQTGLALLPGPILGGLFTVWGGWISEKVGHERLVAWGAAIAAVAVVWPVVVLGEDPNYWSIAPAMGLFGIGWSLTNPPLNSGVLSRVSPDLYGEVNASFNTVRNIAAALGIAVAVTIVGPADRPNPLVVYRQAFIVLAASVALCWLVLRFVYRYVGAIPDVRTDVANAAAAERPAEHRPGGHELA